MLSLASFINCSNLIAATEAGLPLLICGGLLLGPEPLVPWFDSDKAKEFRNGRLRAGAGLGDDLTFSRHTGHVLAVLNHCCTDVIEHPTKKANIR